jgi:hypothetical protein
MQPTAPPVNLPPSPSAPPSEFHELGAEIVNKGGYDLLKFNVHPGAKLFTNQETMSYMDGGLTLKPTLGSGIFSAFARAFTGSSFIQNALENPTSKPLGITLTPFLQGAIVQVKLNHGDMWRFADKSFMACTGNLKVSGNINVFSNFKSFIGGQGLTYVTVTADAGPGLVWVSAYGGSEMHEIDVSNRALYINHGSFLGMLSKSSTVNYWSDYVTVGTTNGIMNAIFTGVGAVMKIQDRTPSIRGPVTCKVLTQSLDRSHLESYINNLAKVQAQQYSFTQGASSSTGSVVSPANIAGNLASSVVSSAVKDVTGGGDSETFIPLQPLKIPHTRRQKPKAKKNRATRRK